MCEAKIIFDEKLTLYKDEENESDGGEEENSDVPKSKLKKPVINLDNVFPSRTLNRYLEDA